MPDSRNSVILRRWKRLNFDLSVLANKKLGYLPIQDVLYGATSFLGNKNGIKTVRYVYNSERCRNPELEIRKDFSEINSKQNYLKRKTKIIILKWGNRLENPFSHYIPSSPVEKLNPRWNRGLNFSRWNLLSPVNGLTIHGKTIEIGFTINKFT